MKIVVGVDGSPASDDALRWAMNEARRWDASVVAVHAWDVPYTAYAGAVLLDERQLEAAAQQVLTDALARTVASPAFPLDERLVRGAPENALAAAAADADLLVVGSSHRGALGRQLIGSVSRAVSDRVACPVVIVHAGAPVTTTGSKVPFHGTFEGGHQRRPPESIDTMSAIPTSPPEIDRNGLEVLDREECLRLLATATLGRIGISSGALPVILPVNFRLVADSIVFRTAPGTKLDAATRGAVVAFEVDAMDPIEHTGWSVMVTGVARPVTEPADLAAVRADRVARWAPVGDERVVAVSTDMVSGRRIR